MVDLVTSRDAGRPAVRGGRFWWHQVIGKARAYAVLIMIAILGTFLTVESSSFLTPVNIINIFNQNAYLLIIASALTLVIISGAFDLSTGAMFAMSSVAAAWCARDPAFVQLFGAGAALIVGPLVGLVLGVVNGVAITSLRIHSFLATLATSLIFRGLAQELAGGNSIVLYGVPGVSWLGQGRIGLIYGAVIVMVVFCCAMAFLLQRTTYGRHVLAVGGNEEAAGTIGPSYQAHQDHGVQPRGIGVWPGGLDQPVARAGGQGDRRRRLRIRRHRRGDFRGHEHLWGRRFGLALLCRRFSACTDK